MSEPVTKEEVIKKIKNWTTQNSDSISVLISQEDGSFHVCYYAGMGDSNNTPIEKLAPQYKVVITELYESGELIESGRAFTLYPGSDSFRKLKLPNNVISKPVKD